MGKELRLLILDESLDFVSALLGQLRTAGFQTLSLRVAGIEGLSLALDDSPWDLVIADYSMPDFLAAGALELIRAKDLDVPLILVSANLGQDVALTALRAGVGDFVPKSQLRWIGPAVERTLREAADRRRRRRAEAALRDSGIGRREAPEEAGNLLVFADPRGSVVSCSAELTGLLGRRREQVLGRNWFQDFVAPDDQVRAREAFLDAIATGSERTLEEYRLVSVDGTLRAVRWQTSVLVDAAGETIGVLGVGVALPYRGTGPNDTVPPSEARRVALGHENPPL